MRLPLALILAILSVGAGLGLLAAQPSADNAFARRRAAVLSRLADGLTIVRAAPGASSVSEYSFRQDRDFFYLTGLDTTGAVLVLDGPDKSAWLFTPPGSAAASAGIEHVEVGDYRTYTNRRLQEGVPTVYDASPVDRGYGLPMARTTPLRELFPRARVMTARAVLDDLRWSKDDAEIRALRLVGMSSAAALRAGMQGVRAGRRQREVEVDVVGACVRSGAVGPSFWPWVMSGPNATFSALVSVWSDYAHHDRVMQPGELVRVDVGCAREHYEGDVGRTVPVSGRFTPEQRDIWTVLVDAYRTARAAMRAGVTLDAVRTAFFDALRRAQPSTPVGRATVEAALATPAAERDSVAHLHGVGLDAGETPSPVLRDGSVVALEPMLAVPRSDETFYLEDMMLVTASGTELLTTDLPYSADEMEAFLARSRAARR